jgi:hypothetical protein
VSLHKQGTVNIFTPLENSGVVAGPLFSRVFREIRFFCNLLFLAIEFLTGFTAHPMRTDTYS